jgi:O-antigen/teichoic acid export membrane protein
MTEETAPRRRLRVRHIALAMVWRGCGVALGFGAAIIMTRTVIETFGVATFGALATVAALPALLPFTDLGAGVAVLNAASDYTEAARRRFMEVTAAALRLLVAVAGLIVLISLGLFATDNWPHLLGPGASGVPGMAGAAALVTCVFAVGIPAGLGYRLLQGCGRTSTQASLQAAVPILLVMFIVVARVLDAPASVFAVGSTICLTVVAYAALLYAVRHFHTSMFELLRYSVHDKAVYRSVAAIGLPALIISVGLAVSMQSDRLILSHLSNSTELAMYSVAAQVLFAVLSVVAIAGQFLWPHYRGQLKARALTQRMFLRHVAAFGLLGLFLSTMMLLTLGLMTSLLTGGAVELPFRLQACLASLIVIQALHQPAAMLLSDLPGLRRQAFLVTLMATVNIGLSILLAPRLGAVAPFLGSILAVGLVQLIPTLLLARERIGRNVSATFVAKMADPT